MTIFNARFGLAAALALCAAATTAQAQQWPTRAVRFIVPFAPGAGADIAGRLAADKLQKFWPQGVVIENRPGGDNLIAIRHVIGAQDDHVLMWGPSGGFTPHPYRHEKLGYDRATELLPIARFSTTSIGFAVATSLGIKTLKEFVDRAKAEPGKFNVVLVPGISEFVWDGFAKTVGINVVKVPYTNLVQGANDMGTGRVQGALAALAILQPSMQGGHSRLITVTNSARAKTQPDMPTSVEQGFPSFELDGLLGLFGPKSMPLESRRKAAEAVVAVGKDPDLQAKLIATGQDPVPAGPEEFSASIERQEAQVAGIAKILGLERKN